MRTHKFNRGTSRQHDGWEQATKAKRMVYKSPRWKKVRKKFLEWNPDCVICGKKANVVDHVIPVSSGKVDFWDETNYQAICWTCHQVKRGQRWDNGGK